MTCPACCHAGAASACAHVHHHLLKRFGPPQHRPLRAANTAKAHHQSEQGIAAYARSCCISPTQPAVHTQLTPTPLCAEPHACISVCELLVVSAMQQLAFRQRSACRCSSSIQAGATNGASASASTSAPLSSIRGISRRHIRSQPQHTSAPAARANHRTVTGERRAGETWICSSSAAPEPSTSPATAPPPLEGSPRVVIIGGTGRVGSSAAAALLSSFPNVKVTLAGRSKASYEAALLRRPELRSTEYKQVDISDAASVQVRRGAGNGRWAG